MKTLSRYALIGWAATILLMGAVIWLCCRNEKLSNSFQIISTENTDLKEAKTTIENRLAKSNEILEVLRSKQNHAYTLPGNQAVAPEAFAKVYINKKDNIIYIDTKGLPTPPLGKVYQVWSLKMEPFAPTSVGLIAKQNETGEGIYKFVNFPDTEALGITLEPKGGSEAPALSQLYILGTLPSI